MTWDELLDYLGGSSPLLTTQCAPVVVYLRAFPHNLTIRSLSLPILGTGHSARDVVSIVLAEFLGTGMLMFLGCMCCVAGFGNTPTNVSGGIGFGFTVMMVIHTFGVVSGAHINPSVSIAAFIYDLVTFPVRGCLMFCFWVGEFEYLSILDAHLVHYCSIRRCNLRLRLADGRITLQSIHGSPGRGQRVLRNCPARRSEHVGSVRGGVLHYDHSHLELLRPVGSAKRQEHRLNLHQVCPNRGRTLHRSRTVHRGQHEHGQNVCAGRLERKLQGFVGEFKDQLNSQTMY